jgi:hypothetical protein
MSQISWSGLIRGSFTWFRKETILSNHILTFPSQYPQPTNQLQSEESYSKKKVIKKSVLRQATLNLSGAGDEKAYARTHAHKQHIDKILHGLKYSGNKHSEKLGLVTHHHTDHCMSAQLQEPTVTALKMKQVFCTECHVTTSSFTETSQLFHETSETNLSKLLNEEDKRSKGQTSSEICHTSA